jgi:hypothetical protein
MSQDMHVIVVVYCAWENDEAQWIITAWQCILPEIIMKVFKNCCVSSAVDRSDDIVLWSD